MSEPDKVRWNELWQAAGGQTEASSHYDQLMALYAEPNRHYHNFQHICECLREFDLAQDLPRQPFAVELAIWFHDAIYDPRAGDNEERSADLANRWLTDNGFEKTLCKSVVQLVLATKQHDGSLDPDAPLLVDIDLSILGQPGERFWEYESQIRKEYGWVPENVFAQKRAEILKRFLSRRTIYNTEIFFAKYEEQARKNLGASMKRLLHA